MSHRLSPPIAPESMGGRPYIEVSLYRGDDAPTVTVRVPMPETMVREVCQPLDISDEPFTLAMESMRHGTNYVTFRRRVVKFRGEVADQTAAIIKTKLIELMEANDIQDGYPKERLRRG